MIGACILGFYLFARVTRPLEHTPILDSSLLVICMVGQVGIDIFSMFAVIDGKDNKIDGWSATFALPFFDVLQCVIQVGELLTACLHKHIQC